MDKQGNILFRRFLLLFALLMLSSPILIAQKMKTTDKINFDYRAYHKKTGWINSVGIYFGNWDEVVKSIFEGSEDLSYQFGFNLFI